jgi:uncharacterized membrane protein YgcG
MVFAVTGAAFAHQPFFAKGTETGPDTAFVLPDAQISRVVYVEMGCTGAAFWMRLDAAAGTSLFLQLGTPVIPALSDYRPTLYLIGPGLPAASDTPPGTPDGLGALVFPATAEADPPVFHEPFTDTDSWILAASTETLPASGAYYLVAVPKKEVRGRLWIATGTQEVPGGEPGALAKVKAFHDGATAANLGQACGLGGTGGAPGGGGAGGGGGGGALGGAGAGGAPEGGCGCTLAGGETTDLGGWAVIGAIALLALGRHRRSSDSR